jgi:small subunit ribosomal protein S17
MRFKKGVVTSKKMDKTIVVSTETYVSHTKYKKRFKITKKFYAHDEDNKYNE